MLVLGTEEKSNSPTRGHFLQKRKQKKIDLVAKPVVVPTNPQVVQQSAIEVGANPLINRAGA